MAFEKLKINYKAKKKNGPFYKLKTTNGAMNIG
jgi:hypothetical protein